MSAGVLLPRSMIEPALEMSAAPARPALTRDKERLAAAAMRTAPSERLPDDTTVLPEAWLKLPLADSMSIEPPLLSTSTLAPNTKLPRANSDVAPPCELTSSLSVRWRLDCNKMPPAPLCVTVPTVSVPWLAISRSPAEAAACSEAVLVLSALAATEPSTLTPIPPPLAFSVTLEACICALSPT